jgi:eukaryotic-like serine/threonine-protein kinase
MTPEELGRIRAIYEQILPMNESEREAYIRRECPDEENIRAEIERLLKAHGDVPDWLERPILGAIGEFATFAPPKLEGRRLSGYTLIREIGRGGMGSVFLAERSDKTFHRKAAIKLILPPAGSAAVIARFQQEREILASLDHPNIAKLLDAGVTEEGWPYFVMEFVEGRPIHRWCDERKLNISERV